LLGAAWLITDYAIGLLNASIWAGLFAGLALSLGIVTYVVLKILFWIDALGERISESRHQRAVVAAKRRTETAQMPAPALVPVPPAPPRAPLPEPTAVVITFSALGAVLGVFGLVESLVPLLGAFAFITAIPALLCSFIGLGLAFAEKCRKLFPVVAITICCLALMACFLQFVILGAVGEAAQQEEARHRQQMQQQMNNWMHGFLRP
jgi:hypothetical protein